MTFQEIINFRHELHQHPELSGKEFATQKRIFNLIKQLEPDEIIKIANTGLAVIYKGIKAGKTLIFRADIDALPISEMNPDIKYTSLNKGIAHLCGHDGHTAVLLALARKLHIKKPDSGRVVLLFQPAEETGQGAMAVLKDKNFQQIQPDYIFGFHNLPGFDKNSLFIRKNIFAAASGGIIIEFSGKTTHAAEPEKGINPAFAMAQLIEYINKKINRREHYTDLAFATIVHIRMGAIAFGTSPGNAVVMLTLRAFQDDDLSKMKNMLYQELQNICNSEKINYFISETEQFPSLINDKTLFDKFYHIASKNKYKIKILDKPFRWSEDFAYFSQKYPAFYFGIGAGNISGLHSVDYDFPDDIITPAADFLEQLIRNIDRV